MSQSCGWPGACSFPFSCEKLTGPGPDWKPPLQIHFSLHSALANRQGPTNHPATPARKKPSLLATGTSPTRQPAPEAPALPTEHPEAVTPAKPGLMDSLNFICPWRSRDKIEKQTPCTVQLVICTTMRPDLCPSPLSPQIWESICMRLIQGQGLGASGDTSTGFGHFGSFTSPIGCE